MTMGLKGWDIMAADHEQCLGHCTTQTSFKTNNELGIVVICTHNASSRQAKAGCHRFKASVG